MQSLYEKYGGFSTVSTIVHDFYDRVWESDTLASFFEGTDMDRLIAHQTTFFCKILGGPDNYKGRSLKGAHRGTGITHAAFDEVASILIEVLEDAGVEGDDVATIGGVLESVRNDVVDADLVEASAAQAAP